MPAPKKDLPEPLAENRTRCRSHPFRNQPQIRIPKSEFQNHILLLTGLLAMLAARMIWHGSLRYSFLVWNIFLAILPLLFAHGAVHSRKKPLQWLYAALWLIFFPNAAYLLTDIAHLRATGGAAYWLDLVLFFSAGLYGVVLGMRSLHLVAGWYGRMLSPFIANAVTLLLLFGNGYGIYLGRVERWNSWDVVLNPGELLQSVAYELRHPFRCIEVWSLSSVFAAALGLAYLAYSRRIFSAGE